MVVKIYLVGGAVRDKLLQLPVKERDWVVVGATPDVMLNAGYRPVGKDYPVFLHPETHEEYALARTERKVAKGYHGFNFYAAPEVTLEEDLSRRDLTINAIAQDEQGNLIDPYGGVADCKNRILRHVSGAFAEDPVRILRLARFAARFAPLGFCIAPPTLSLMKQMTAAGEVDALVPERVWTEMYRALLTDRPSVFFKVLHCCGALKVLLPVPKGTWSAPCEYLDQAPDMVVLDQAVRLSDDSRVRFATLVFDLVQDVWTVDRQTKSTIELVQAIGQRLRVPRQHAGLALTAIRYYPYYHQITQNQADEVVAGFRGIDAYRRPENFRRFLHVCEAQIRGYATDKEKQAPQTNQMLSCFQASAAIDIASLITGLKGEAIGRAIDQARAVAIDEVRKQWTDVDSG